jgi:hypothetical protein
VLHQFNNFILILFTTLILVLVLGALVTWPITNPNSGTSSFGRPDADKNSLNKSTLKQEISSFEANSEPPPPPPFLKTDSLPSGIQHKVPFSPQAPLGNWQEPYANACEETSLLMAMAWVKGTSTLSPGQVDAGIREIIQYEKESLGLHKDTSAQQTSLILAEFFDHSNHRLAQNVKIKDIKKALSEGSVVIAPVIGGLLNNPFYKSESLFYHMLVITGYDDEKEIFFTNDPGTRYGENFAYNYATLEKALTDWDELRQKPSNPNNAIIIISK